MALGGDRIEEIVQDVHHNSRFYVRMALGQEEDRELREAFADVNTLKVDVAYPFFLDLYDAYHAGRLDRTEFVAIVRLIESYVFRRAICGVPTQGLNKVFAGLAREINRTDCLERLSVDLLHRDAGSRFPTDEEFSRELVAKDLYNFRGLRYCLRRLENHGRKERVAVEEYTVEHVLPQNPTLSREWRDELGDQHEQIQKRYLHTIGNLTLTGYNPELSDRPFTEKRDMKGGFSDSPIRLNQGLSKLERWTESAIVARGEDLAGLACEVWPFPTASAETRERFRKPRRDERGVTYTLNDHPQLNGPMRALFDRFRRCVLDIHPAVREQPRKLYIAYKTTTNFVDLQAQKSRLRLTLNMRFEEVHDPKGLCKDVTDIGRWGNGDVEIDISSLDQLDDVMSLVRQAFDKHPVASSDA